jgi:hypothetical protein
MEARSENSGSAGVRAQLFFPLASLCHSTRSACISNEGKGEEEDEKKFCETKNFCSFLQLSLLIKFIFAKNNSLSPFGRENGRSLDG